MELRFDDVAREVPAACDVEWSLLLLVASTTGKTGPFLDRKSAEKRDGSPTLLNEMKVE